MSQLATQTPYCDAVTTLPTCVRDSSRKRIALLTAAFHMTGDKHD